MYTEWTMEVLLHICTVIGRLCSLSRGLIMYTEWTMEVLSHICTVIGWLCSLSLVNYVYSGAIIRYYLNPFCVIRLFC